LSTESLGGFEIDSELKPHGLNRQLGGFDSFISHSAVGIMTAREVRSLRSEDNGR